MMSKQKTRLVKAWCDDCEYTIRITRKWISIRCPICPMCRKDMSTELPENPVADPKQTTIFERVRGDKDE
jgi:hypothetical protein